MKLPASQALHGYWTSLRAGRRAPERNALDPAAMRHLLAQTFLIEIDPTAPHARRLPIRVSGTRLDALFTRDLKGTDFIDLWSDRDAGLLRDIATDVVDSAAPALLGGHAGPGGATPIGYELLLLPLRHEGRTHSRMLGGLAFSRTPSWLGLQPARSLHVEGWRMLDDQARPDTGPELDAATPLKRHAHLIIHEGGRASGTTMLPQRQVHVNAPVSRWVSRS